MEIFPYYLFLSLHFFIFSSNFFTDLLKEKLPTLFDTQFERSEAAKKVASLGSGVGLYLAGQIIKAHNGRVWAESGGEGEGKGSAFFVELPTTS